MSEYIFTTNWGMRKRHIAAKDSMHPFGEGLEGYPLCTQNYQTWDQESRDHFRLQYAGKPGPRIETLPLCTRCEKRASELGVIPEGNQ
jgi:hypothetical protein